MSAPEKMTAEQAAQRLWEREGGHCVSTLVYTLARGAYEVPSAASDMAELCEEASDLRAPLQDYKEAALQAGWRYEKARMTGQPYFVKGGDISGRREMFDGWQDLCESEDIEPHDIEILEHWIVSSWLARKLAAMGERTGDLAGLPVWGRTISG
jgi:hypothetical protein